jgi:hypothetical protein
MPFKLPWEAVRLPELGMRAKHRFAPPPLLLLLLWLISSYSSTKQRCSYQAGLLHGDSAETCLLSRRLLLVMAKGRRGEERVWSSVECNVLTSLLSIQSLCHEKGVRPISTTG